MENTPAEILAAKMIEAADLQGQIDVMKSIIKSYKLGEYVYVQAKVDARRRRLHNLQARQRRLKQKTQRLRVLFQVSPNE